MKLRFILIVFLLPLFSEVLAQVDSLRRLLDTTKDDSIRSVTLNKLGRIYMFTKYDSADFYFYEALALSRNSNIPEMESYTIGNLGVLKEIQNNYVEAIKYYYEALKIAEKLRNERLKTFCYGNMGRAFQSIDKLDEALEFFLLELDYYQLNKIKRKEAGTLNNIGGVYNDYDSTDKAFYYFKKSLAIREETGQYKGSVLQNIGKYYLKHNQYDSAIIYLKRALKNKKETNRNVTLSTTYYTLGEYYTQKKDFSKVLSYYWQALGCATEYSLFEDLSYVSDKLSDYYFNLKLYDSAFYYKNKYSTYLDSVNKNSKEGDIIKLQSNYELEKVTLKSQLLEKENQIIKQEASYQRTITIVLSIFIVLFIPLLIGLIYLFLQKRKAHKQIEEVNELVSGMNHNLNDELQEKVKELKYKNKKILDYAFINSHRLRAPIANIIGLINVLSFENDETEKYILHKKIKETGEKLNQITIEINDVLMNERRKND